MVSNHIIYVMKVTDVNTASITTEEIAEAVEAVGSVFADSNTNVNELIALLGAGNRGYQNADTLALALRTAALRIRSCSSELENLGEDTEGVITSTSKLQEKIKALTNVDGSGGVSILEEDGETFRSIYDIFLDISKVYQQMSDVDQSALLELIAGKNRASAVSATLNNMSEAAEIYENSLNSAGSAQKEYQEYLGSTEASVNRLKASVTEMYQSIITGSTVSDLANAGSAVVDFATDWGLVEGSLKAIISIGIAKFLTTAALATVQAAKATERYGKAIELSNTIQTQGNLSQRFSTLKQLAALTNGLTDAQLKQVLSSKALSVADRTRILMLSGMSKEAANAKLSEFGLTQATNSATAATNAQTASTFSLKAAMIGLSNSIRTAFLNNPVGISLMAISIGVSALTTAISNNNQKLEEAREKAKEAADEADELGDEIADLANQYIQLSDAVKNNQGSKEDLLSVQDEIIKKLGLESDGIEDLIDKYGSLDAAIKSITIEELQDKEIDLIAGVDAAEEELLDIGKTFEHWYSTSSRNLLSASGEDAAKAYNVLEKAGLIDSGSHSSNGGFFALTGNDKTVEGILENYDRLQEALKALQNSGEFTEEELSDNPVFKQLYDRSQEMEEYVTGYNDAISNLNENIAQQMTLTALQGNELPQTEEEFESFREELLETATASGKFIGSEEDITTSINNYLASTPQFEGFYSVPLAEELEATEAVVTNYKSLWSDLTDDQTSAIDDFQSQIKTLSEALESIKDGSIDSGELLDLQQEFTSLDVTADDLDEQILKLIDTLLNDIYNSFDNPPDGLLELLQGIKDAALDTTVALDDAFSSIQKSYDALHDFKDALDNDSLTDSILNSVASLSDEMNDLVAGFYAGGVSADELYTALTEHYNTDLENYGNALIAKNGDSESFYNSVGMMSSEVTDQFSKDYGVDIGNCKTYNEAKLQIEMQTLQTLSDKWGQFYNTQTDELTGLANYLQITADQMSGTQKMKFISQSGLGEILSVVNKYKNAVDGLNQITYDGIETSFEKISSSLDKNSSSSSSSSASTIDWISRKVETLNNDLDKLSSKLQNAFTVKGKKSIIDKEITKAKELADVYQKAEDTYNAIADAYAKQNSGVLTKSMIAKIKSGDYSISDYDSDTANIISTYQEYWDNANDAAKSYQDTLAKIYGYENDYAEIIIESQQEEIEKSEKLITARENLVKLKETFGGSASKKDLEYENNQYSEQIQMLQADNEILKALKKTVAKGSDAWNTYNDQINANKESIDELNLSIAETAQAIANLPLDKYNDYLDKNSTKQELLEAKLENRTTVKGKNAITDKLISISMNNASKAQNYYAETQNNLANAVTDIETARNTDGIKKSDKNYKKVQQYVSSGKKVPASLINELPDTLAQACTSYNDALAANKTAKATAELAAETSKTEVRDYEIEKLQRKQDKYDEKADYYSAKADAATTAKESEKWLKKQSTQLEKSYDTQIEIARVKGDTVLADTLQVQKEQALLEIQKQELQNYVDEYDAKSALLDAENEVSTNYVEQNKNLDKKKSYLKSSYQYQIGIAQLENDTTEALRLQVEYEKELIELEKEKFDNIQSYYEKRINLIDREFTQLDNKVSELEAAGSTVSKSYYEAQKDVIAVENAWYNQENERLEQQLSSIKKGTDEWFECVDAIQENNNKISEGTQKLYELQDAINQLHFDAFDKMGESIDRVTSEQEFLRSLFDYANTTDEDTGNFTEAGIAKLGSFAASYYASQNKASRDAEEIAELQRMLNSGNLHSDLLDVTFNSIESLEDKLNEMYSNWRDDIKETYSYESDIVDLKKEKYNAEMDLVNELISKKKEALQSEKDLYDYQRSIADKTKTITTLQQQIAAYAGDSSDESKSKLQKLQSQLNDAEEDLKDTEYERYLQDTEDMLDKLADEYEELITAKLDDFMSLLQEGLDTANENSSVIGSYLSNIASANGYTEQTKGLFANSGDIKTSTDNVIGTITDKVKEYTTFANETATREIQAISGEQNAITTGIDIEGTAITSSIGQNTEILNNSVKDIGSSIYTTDNDINNNSIMLDNDINANASTVSSSVVSAADSINSSLYSVGNRVIEAMNLSTSAVANAVQGFVNDTSTAISSLSQSLTDTNNTVSSLSQSITNTNNAIASLSQSVANAASSAQTTTVTVTTEEKSTSSSGSSKSSKSSSSSSSTTSSTKKTSTAKKTTTSSSSSGSSKKTSVALSTGNKSNTMKTYATGGIVDSDNLLDEIKKHGDDTIVGVKTGEGILTPVQTAQFDELVKSLPDLNYAANMMKDIVKAPDMSNLVPVNNIGGDISIDLGGIVMNGVNDPEEFQKQIISAFQNSQKVQKVARAATTDLLAGKGRLGVQRIR